MADQTLWGLIGHISPSSATFDIYKVLTNGTATPEIVFNAARVIPHSFKVVDFKVLNTTGVQVGATAQLFSTLNGGARTAISDLLATTIDSSIARATTIDRVQSLLTAGSATEDVLDIAKNANTDAGMAFITAILR